MNKHNTARVASCWFIIYLNRKVIHYFRGHLQDSLSRGLQQVVDDIYVICSEIVEEFGIDVKLGPIYKAEETRFTLRYKTPLIIGGKEGSLLVLSVVMKLQGLDFLVPLKCKFRHSLH